MPVCSRRNLDLAKARPAQMIFITTSRYAAEFVIRKLLQKYSTKKTSKAYDLVDCLEGMKNTEMDDLEPALKKSKKWIETTDIIGSEVYATSITVHIDSLNWLNVHVTQY